MLAIATGALYRDANTAALQRAHPGMSRRYGDPTVLVVSRKPGERILIGEKIAITVVKVAGGAVRLGIEAPPELAVMREELALEIRKAEQAAMESSER